MSTVPVIKQHTVRPRFYEKEKMHVCRQKEVRRKCTKAYQGLLWVLELEVISLLFPTMNMHYVSMQWFPTGGDSDPTMAFGNTWGHSGVTAVGAGCMCR